MDDKPKDEGKEPTPPVLKSWDELKKEARTQAKEKYAKKLIKEVKDETVQSEPDKKLEGPTKMEGEDGKETPKETPREEPKVDVGEVARKAAQQAADKVAEAAKVDKAEFQAKLDQILNKDQDILIKQKEADELITAWDKEKRLPKDYKELIDETMRVADAKMAHKQRELEAKAKEDKPTAPEPPKVDENTQKIENYQKEIVTDLKDIYDAKFLPKPANLDEINNLNTTDEAAKETQKLLDFGVKLNTERVKTLGADGRPLKPITSLNKIYFLYYKPTMDKAAPKTDQPAGADAPVSPSRNQSTTESNQAKPFYQKGEDGQYRAKSWAQIKYETLKAKLGR